MQCYKTQDSVEDWHRLAGWACKHKSMPSWVAGPNLGWTAQFVMG